LIFNKIHRHIHFADIMIQGSGPDEQRISANFINGSFSLPYLSSSRRFSSISFTMSSSKIFIT